MRRRPCVVRVMSPREVNGRPLLRAGALRYNDHNAGFAVFLAFGPLKCATTQGPIFVARFPPRLALLGLETQQEVRRAPVKLCKLDDLGPRGACVAALPTKKGAEADLKLCRRLLWLHARFLPGLLIVCHVVRSPPFISHSPNAGPTRYGLRAGSVLFCSQGTTRNRSRFVCHNTRIAYPLQVVFCY